MPDCPSDHDLAGFLNDTLTAARVAGVSAHVDACADCQRRLDRLTQHNESAIERYKQLSSVLLVSAPSGIESSPDAGTLIIGGPPPPIPAGRLVGLPGVPGFDVLTEIG